MERVKPTQRQQLSPNATGTERTQQQGDKNADLQTQLHDKTDKQKEFEATQEMVQLLRKGKKNLTDR